MFNFLNLQNSNSGDARRHVPFASIIHKHIFPLFFITIFFLSIFFRPYKASALAQLSPEVEPVYETTIETLYEFVKVQLDDSQRQAFELFLGTYMVGYAGMSDYKLDYVYNSDAPLKEWLINSGADIYNTILSLGGIAPEGSSTPISPGINVPNIGYQQLKPLLQIAMGAAVKSKNYTDADDLYNDIMSSDSYPVVFRDDTIYSLNAGLSAYSGLYEWQFNYELILPSSFEFDWGYQSNLSGSNQEIFENYLNNMSDPIKFKYDHGYKSSYYLSTYNNIFYNLLTDTVYLVDENGNVAPSGFINVDVLYYAPGVSAIRYYTNNSTYNIEFRTLNASNYGSLQSLFSAINSDPSLLIYSSYGNLDMSTFVKGLYYGNSWSERSPWQKTTDLGLVRPNKPTYLSGVSDGLLDIKGLLQDILNNLELYPPVINNYYHTDGEPVTEAEMKTVTEASPVPESGVDLDQDVFNNFFVTGSGKSFVSYLWYMTKPLVLFTKDLFDCLIFDPVNGFAASGPGYFVFGVIGLGLISGFLAKCLL